MLEILAGIVTSTPECAALFAPAGTLLADRASAIRQPELADALERLGAEGAGPFYTGDIGGGDRRLGARARRDADAPRTWPPTG